MVKPRVTSHSKKNTPASLLFCAAYCLLLSVALVLLDGPAILLAIYAVMSSLTYLAFGFDKRAAQKGQSRISEKTLHLLSLFCGWPGALLAQHRLRHKTVKQPFKAVLWILILLNCNIVMWSFYPEFRSSWHDFLVVAHSNSL
ncbi:DUF1294 domain-containing protein [Marinomonas ostreistagni]|uniref:DUF1294 domain-containing protein n=1 Tax=Marinomonas ostreistagni TaxID=359209 RepID=A0ABS0Z9C9_9GAMM|nr:DUF1294 domain-containing protein [Marinomonas ostreistagni]MBJ7550260.1 DUF1294 domain-containing protein [Marinomonas ostreistagni]